jgi:hypothetical protein
MPAPAESTTGPREWTKADWKVLDACFTEERLHVGAQRGYGNDQLADVDDVDLEDVVTRFMCTVGGYEAVHKLGSAWTE